MESFSWQPYIPPKEITLVTSITGVGKTLFCLRLAADYSAKGKIMIFEWSDRSEYLRRNLKAMGADLEKIAIYDALGVIDNQGYIKNGSSYDCYNFADKWDNLEYVIQRFQPSLVIVDHVDMFFGEDEKCYETANLTRCLRAARVLAQRYNLAMLLTENTTGNWWGKTDIQGLANNPLISSILYIESHKEEKEVWQAKLAVGDRCKGEGVYFKISTGENGSSCVNWETEAHL